MFIYLICLSIAATSVSGEYLSVISGENAQFPTKNCSTGGSGKLFRLLSDGTPVHVASLEADIWIPEPMYQNRINKSGFLILQRANLMDGGVYELECNDRILIHLTVIVPFEVSVTVGETVPLQCPRTSDTQDKVKESYMFWEKDGKPLPQTSPPGKATYGEQHGDQHTIKAVSRSDAGIYFCKTNITEAAMFAVRLNVRDAPPQTTPTKVPACPDGTQTNITAAVLGPVAALLGLSVIMNIVMLLWKLKILPACISVRSVETGGETHTQQNLPLVQANGHGPQS